MARKKKKQDARGYSQQQQLPTHVPTPAAPAVVEPQQSDNGDSSVVVVEKTATETPTPVVISADPLVRKILPQRLTHKVSAASPTVNPIHIRPETQTLLDGLLDDLQQQQQKQQPTLGSTRRRKTPPLKVVTRLYDRLAAHGFIWDDIQRAVVAAVLNDHEEDLPTAALDWLCLNLATSELPPLFTEGSVREEERAVQEQQDAVTVWTGPAVDPSQVREAGSKVEENALKTPNRQSSTTSTTQSEKEESRSEQRAFKQRILQQYEYEDDTSPLADDDAKQREKEQTSETRGTEDPEQSPTLINETEAAQDHPTEPPELVQHRQELETLRTELTQVEIDVKDEAANYMRSKHEVKELKKRLQKFRCQVRQKEGRVKGLEKKWISTLSKSVPNNSDDNKKDNLFGEADSQGTSEDEGVAATDLFVSTPSVSCAAVPGNAEHAVSIPENAIPKSWTGKTPKLLLEEWCRNGKLPKPSFQKLGASGCRLIVKLKKRGSDKVRIEQPGPTSSYLATQHYVSTRALYQLQSDQPLYRLLPPFFRHLWLDWLAQEKEENDAVTREIDEARQQKVEELVQLIDQTLHSSSDTQKGGAKSTVVQLAAETTEDVPDSWEDIDVGKDCRKEKVTTRSTSRTPQNDNDSEVRSLFMKQRQSDVYRSMLASRQKLPVFSFRDHILDIVANHNVTIISAETGAGKTTQFLLECALENAVGASVVCTQPRRVAALSVAERVSDEMAQKSIGDLVGYQIRLDTRMSKRTRLLFCTTGIVLRRLVDDPTLEGTTHVIVDECHERQWQVDLLVVMLRQLLQGPRPDLKVILMSATLDTELFVSFFSGAPVISVPGRTFPVSKYFLEDILEQTGFVIEPGSRYALRSRNSHESVSLWVTTKGGERRRETADIATEEDIPLPDEFLDYSMQTRRSMMRVNESMLNYDLIEEVLYHVADQKGFTPLESKDVMDGAILIFLPGLGEIRALTERLGGSRVFGHGKFDIIPLHSSLSPKDQRRAFVKPKTGRRKIIVSTNIAETSVTIPDVTVVIDSGLVREIQRDKRSGTRKLVATWCSRASTKQRAGRAGRVRPGICLRLFSSKTESFMKQNPEPEIRRIPLEEICLSVLASGLSQSCQRFLRQTPEPPLPEAVTFALGNLERIGAIRMQQQSKEVLTPLGQHLTKLPLDARLGKLLVYGSLFSCLGSALTIAACLSASRSPFAASFSQSQVDTSTKGFQDEHKSDFTVFLNMWHEYNHAMMCSNARDYCRTKRLNFEVLREIRDARRQFFDLLRDIGLVTKEHRGSKPQARLCDICDERYCENDKFPGVIHSVVCASLYPNIARVHVEKGRLPIFIHKQEQVSIHGSSSCAKVKGPIPWRWIVFNEKMGTARQVSVSTVCFVSPFALMIFGPNMRVIHEERKIVVDEWIEIGASAKTGVTFRAVQQHVDDALAKLLDQSHRADVTTARQIIDRLVQLFRQQEKTPGDDSV